MKIYINIIAPLMCSLLMVNPASAQSNASDTTESSTAILDTAIPFAIGAREGEQSIRGSFGWPTFQEGFVEGVYFRFDPDGYARFSTSPRLDEDVFEVICQNATTICVARKDGLEIGLTEKGKPQIRISGITPIDKFFISDRKSELPLPNTILGPLDQRLEALLSSGGDLIIRRELETLQTLSLSGFSAAVTYLRWVAQNQASFIFPRGWPAPSQQVQQRNAGLTLPDVWSNTRAVVPQQASTAWPRQTQQVSAGASPTLNNRGLQNTIPRLETRRVTAGPENYETSAFGFAQQAQGRSLPADINRFEVLPPQGGYTQTNNQRAQFNAAGTEDFSVAIKMELAEMNRSLRNLEVRIENLATKISYELQAAGINGTGRKQPGSGIYQGIGEGVRDNWRSPNSVNEQLSEEERLRKLVMESLRQEANQVQGLNPETPKPSSVGEVSIKKNIVERLLEELNGPNKTDDQTDTPVVEATGEFISLSDYINKVMRDEKRN